MKQKRKPKEAEIELESDAWPRFERFIKQVAKAGPQHRQASKIVTTKRVKAKGSKRGVRIKGVRLD